MLAHASSEAPIPEGHKFFPDFLATFNLLVITGQLNLPSSFLFLGVTFSLPHLHIMPLSLSHAALLAPWPPDRRFEVVCAGSGDN